MCALVTGVQTCALPISRVCCAVRAAIADRPCTPCAAKVFRSAWMPAPPPESEPAMVSALMGLDMGGGLVPLRSEEHTSELQSLMRISYAVFCLKNKKYQQDHQKTTQHYTNISNIR